MARLRMALANGDPAAALSISRGGTGVYDEYDLFVFLSGLYLWCVRFGALLFQVSGWDVHFHLHPRVFPQVNLFLTSLIMGRNESEDTRDPGCI